MSVIGSHQAIYLVVAVVVVVVVWDAATWVATEPVKVNSKQVYGSLGLQEALLGDQRLHVESLPPTSGASESPSEETQFHQPLPGELATIALDQLPKPINVSLVIISWYPPLLRLTWRLYDPHEASLKIDLYSRLTSASASAPDIHHNRSISGGQHLLEDLEKLELDENGERLLFGDRLLRQMPELEGLRQRKMLVRKSLNCFQITYNIVNSRFRTWEELPPHASWLHLVNLLPATEYSLQVAAVYLNGARTFGERIQFVTPADNESRRFKDNTYRPIHRYQEEGRAGGFRKPEQARLEELTIVAFALLFWVATICLFFSKWGKIRMLEPYQPAYREADSPAPPFVGPAHHSSLHQLGGSAGGGSGAKLASSLCGAVLDPSTEAAAGLVPLSSSIVVSAACKLASAAAGVGPQVVASSANGLNPVVGGPVGSNGVETGFGSLRGAAGAATVNSLHGAGEFGAPVSSKLRRLATAMRRTETDSSCEQQKQHRRTEAELNLLFQSKAHALAKAANLWTVHQQQQQHHQRQKLRQHQYRTQQADLDTLKRTSKALLRQGQLSCCVEPSGLQSAGSIATGNTQSGTGSEQTRPLHQRPTHHQEERCLSVELAGSRGSTRLGFKGGPLTNLDQQTSKLLERRLLFISKSHQHHHVATSASSGTLRKESSSAGPVPSACISSLAAQVVAQTAAASPAASMVAAATSSTRNLKPNSVSLDTPEVGIGGTGSGGARKRAAQGDDSCPFTGGSAPQMACLRGLQSREATSGGGQESQAKPLHHILIEPPSPPSKSRRHKQLAVGGAGSPGDLLYDSSSALNLGSPGSVSNDFEYEYQENPEASNYHHLHRSGSVSIGCDRLLSGDSQRVQAAALTTSDHLNQGPITDRSRSAHLEEGRQEELTWRRKIVAEAGGGGQRLDNQLLAASCHPRDKPAICLEPVVAQRPGQTDTCPSSWGVANVDPRSSTDDSQHEAAPTGDEMSADDELANQEQREESRDAFARLRDSSRHVRRRHLASSQLTGSTSTALAKGAQVSSLGHPSSYVRPRNRSSSSSLAELACHLRPTASALASGGMRATAGCSLCSASSRVSSCVALLAPTTAPSPVPGRGGGGNHCRELGSISSSSGRPRLCSVFVASPYSRSKRGSFAMLHALSQKKSKSAEDVAHLSSLVLEIWARVGRNPLLQSVSHQQLATNQYHQHGNDYLTGQGGSRRRSHRLPPAAPQESHQQTHHRPPSSSLTVAHML